MNPAVVLIMPFFGLATACETKVFLIGARGEEGDDDGGDVVVKLWEEMEVLLLRLEAVHTLKY